MALIATSIVAADWTRFGEALETTRAAGASMVHVDVMDGHFVPEISVGQPVVASLRKATELPVEVHLLVERPERFVEDFLKAGADRVSVQFEATHHLPGLLDSIRAGNAKAGVALAYRTPLDAASEILGDLDFVTILCAPLALRDSQEEFNPRSIEKVRGAVRAREERRLSFAIEADGGIGAGNHEQVAAAGADILVVGSDIFTSVDPQNQLVGIVRTAAQSHGSFRA